VVPIKRIANVLPILESEIAINTREDLQKETSAHALANVNDLSAFLRMFADRHQTYVRSKSSTTWRNTSQWHYLSDEELIASLQANSSLRRAFGTLEKTWFAVIQVDGSKSATAIQTAKNLHKQLKDIGLLPKSFYVEELDLWQTYLFFSEPVSSQKVTAPLKAWLDKSWFTVDFDATTVLPSGEPLQIPLQASFTWLNEDLGTIVAAGEMSFQNAVSMFMQDVRVNSTTLELFESALSSDVASLQSVDCTPGTDGVMTAEAIDLQSNFQLCPDSPDNNIEDDSFTVSSEIEHDRHSGQESVMTPCSDQNTDDLPQKSVCGFFPLTINQPSDPDVVQVVRTEETVPLQFDDGAFAIAPVDLPASEKQSESEPQKFADQCPALEEPISFEPETHQGVSSEPIVQAVRTFPFDIPDGLLEQVTAFDKVGTTAINDAQLSQELCEPEVRPSQFGDMTADVEKATVQVFVDTVQAVQAVRTESRNCIKDVADSSSTLCHPNEQVPVSTASGRRDSSELSFENLETIISPESDISIDLGTIDHSLAEVRGPDEQMLPKALVQFVSVDEQEEESLPQNEEAVPHLVDTEGVPFIQSFLFAPKIMSEQALPRLATAKTTTRVDKPRDGPSKKKISNSKTTQKPVPDWDSFEQLMLPFGSNTS
jgi:hypothetical protein